MNILNRSAITTTAKQPFIDWANALAPDFPLSLGVLGESKTYLTNPDFDDAEKHLKKYYKEIFENEVVGIWLDENDWPQKRDYKTFCEWFQVEISDCVVDLSKKSIFSI